MYQRAPKLIASAFLVVTLATACGGGGRPSVDDIADGITSNSDAFGDIDDDAAQCVAKAFHDSDLSDDALQAIVDGDEDYDADEDDVKAASEVSTEGLADCIGDIDVPEIDELESPSS